MSAPAPPTPPAPAPEVAASTSAPAPGPSGDQGGAGAPPAPPRRSAKSRKQDECVCNVPCNRCLRQMSDWKPTQVAAFLVNLPRCFKTTSASNKCKRYTKIHGKACVPATRATTMAAIKLRRLFKEEITKAQLAGKKSLQRQANQAKTPDAKRKAKAEEEEWLLRQHRVVALKASANAARRQAKAAKSLAKTAKVAAIAIKA
ncbi:hypothetical protein LZ31DRAFT_636304 [Colletotrichum somersetense]|nr:hypothetical protein LZ31DRAFT_636304 [Colletotrichum somersetense]